MRKMHVALLGDVFYTWDGGIDFLADIAAKFKLFNEVKGVEKYQLYLVLPKDFYIVRKARDLRQADQIGEKKRLERIIEATQRACPDVKVVYYRRFPKRIFDDKGKRLEYSLKAIGADICFPMLRAAYPEISIPWMGYIADFQEKYLPELFDEKILNFREKNSIMQAKNTKFFLFNSNMVKADMEKFYPYGEYEIFVQPYAPIFNANDLRDMSEEVRSKYELAERYFLISNQYWNHKSHKTAFAALKILHEWGEKDVHIYCTGNHQDYRNKEYVEDLFQFVKENDLSQYIHFLGFIPKREQIAIMKRGAAVLQPSLFEGDVGGGAVYTAIAHGVPVIMADIRVNREINEGEKVFFFRSQDAKDLASKMKDILRMKLPEVNQSELIEQSNSNVELLERFYDEMLHRVIAKYRKKKFEGVR